MNFTDTDAGFKGWGMVERIEQVAAFQLRSVLACRHTMGLIKKLAFKLVVLHGIE
jgi:hypothetical protein